MLQKKRKFDTTAFLFIAPAFILFTVFWGLAMVGSLYGWCSSGGGVKLGS